MLFHPSRISNPRFDCTRRAMESVNISSLFQLSRLMASKLFATIATNIVSLLWETFLPLNPQRNNCKCHRVISKESWVEEKRRRKFQCTYCIIWQHMLLMPFNIQPSSGRRVRAQEGELWTLKMRFRKGWNVWYVCARVNEGGSGNPLKWFINHLQIQVTIKSVWFDISTNSRNWQIRRGLFAIITLAIYHGSELHYELPIHLI